MLMDSPIVDFTRLTPPELIDGVPAFLSDDSGWYWSANKAWGNLELEYPRTAVEQALLQSFTQFGCGVSMLRLGRSLLHSYRYPSEIQSDYLGLQYLLSGMDAFNIVLRETAAPLSIKKYVYTPEFIGLCQLAIHEVADKNISICPELSEFLRKSVSHIQH